MTNEPVKITTDSKDNFGFFLFLILIFICKTWAKDGVNDFHSWGLTFGWFVFELLNHVERCMMRRCFKCHLY